LLLSLLAFYDELTGNASYLSQVYDWEEISVSWDVELSGIPAFMRGSVQKRLGKGTEEALERIEKAAT
jgi:hypothetical protein